MNVQNPNYHIRLNFFGSESWKGKMTPLVSITLNQTLLKPEAKGTLFDLKAGNNSIAPFDFSVAESLEFAWNESKGIDLSSTQPEYWIQLNRQAIMKKNRKPDWLNMGISESFFESDDCIDEFLYLSKTLYSWGSIFYGYISHPDDYKAQAFLKQNIIINNKVIGDLGRDIRQMIPGIFWGNFFNSAFVDWFGREKFEALPCYRLEHLSDGGVFIQMSSSPLEYDETGADQEAVKKHLGRNVFADVHNPDAPTISPIQDGVITIPDESKDWPQRLTDLQKKMSDDT